MYKLVVLACAVAAVAAEADPVYAYANGLHYGAAYANLPLNYAAGYAGNIYHPSAITAGAPAALAAAPATVVNAYDAHAHAHVAGAYALPAARTIHEAPIVEQTVEPVEQWGYKVAY